MSMSPVLNVALVAGAYGKRLGISQLHGVTACSKKPRFVRRSCSAPKAGSITCATQAEPDPVTVRVRKELAENGVDLDELLNAAKVVNLTRKLDDLDTELSQQSLDSSKRAALMTKQEKIKRQLVIEKRQVMQLWLKRTFLVQAIIFTVVGGMMAANAVPTVESLPVVAQAFGFWSVWLFTIPSLRARKGIRTSEKSALNVAFLVTPFLNLVLPMITRNCGTIWSADVGLLAACYLWYGITAKTTTISAGEGAGADVKLKKGTEAVKIKGILRFLDWGSWR